VVQPPQSVRILTGSLKFQVLRATNGTTDRCTLQTVPFVVCGTDVVPKLELIQLARACSIALSVCR